METISNIANTASKLIYGDKPAEQSGQEPVSGEAGRGTATDPYDSGNLEENPTMSGASAQETRAEAAPSDTVGASSTTATTTTTTPATTGNTDSGAKSGSFGTADPSVGADPASAQKPTQKQQGGDRPAEEPVGEQADAVKEKKDEGEIAMEKRDPNDHSGEPLKVHDGSEKKQSSDDPTQPKDDAAEKSEDKGTGEKYVKSSGLKADGGDFDAAKPGAGREADRLLEQKGVQRAGAEDNGKAVSKDETSPARSGSDKSGSSKPSIGTKIKEKLHISKH